MTRTIALTALAVILAAPALARPVLYTCKFTERCTEGGCESTRDTYQFRLDVETGEGSMLAEGKQWDGIAVESDGTQSYFFVNSAGVEMVTINQESDNVVYTGHMGFGADLSTYQLTGTCLRQ